MNDEIKEILRIAKECHFIDISFDECDLLLDYITNLQQENERLKELNAELKAITKRPTPIDYAMIQKRYDDCKSRCEKAIEELKTANVNIDSVMLCETIEYAIYILQNGDDSQ